MLYRPFTLVVPYFEQPQMFREQQRAWCALSEDVRAALHVIVVDDCSDEAPAGNHVLPETKAALADFRVLKLDVKVRWNWIGCRNRGVDQAKTEWVLMTDMDHVIPHATWRRLMRDSLDPMRAYRLSRLERKPDGTDAPRDPHPNTWIMTRQMFLNRVGGYDERFSGIYGSDGQFHGRVTAWALRVALLPDYAIVYTRDVVPDAETTRYERKTAEDREQRTLVKSQIQSLGASYTPNRLTFPWSQVL